MVQYSAEICGIRQIREISPQKFAAKTTFLKINKAPQMHELATCFRKFQSEIR